MPKPSTLLVVANPYCSLDADGEPSGVANRADIRGDLIGCVLDRARSKDGALKYSFTDEPVALPDMQPHRKLLRTGQIFPADEKTARLVGIPFVPPADALAHAKDRVAVEYFATYGELPPFAEQPDTSAPAQVGGGS